MKLALIALLGEIRKVFLINWTYRMNLLISLVTLGFIFILIIFFVSGGQMDEGRVASALVGYLVWMYLAAAVSDMTYGLRAEITAGTLEQLEMSPAPAGLLLVGRVIGSSIITSLQVTVLGIVVMLLFNIRLPIRPEAIVVLLITIVGVLGFGFIMAGAVLIFKQIEAMSNLLNNALAFLNGAFLPISSMPGWLAGFSMTLPSTLGIIVIRAITFEGKTLAETWQDGSLIGLIANSTLYLLVGCVVFYLCERAAMNRGSLGQY